MEKGRLSSRSNLETGTLLENLSGCCEGTVFTFTSAGSKWRLRQRLNRNKSSLLNSHGGPLFKEDPADSVFTEMRMMPQSSETTQPDGMVLWNRSKYLPCEKAEDPSRSDNMAYHDTGELRSYRRVCKLTTQAGDQRGKLVPNESMKADYERKELQVFKEETIPRRSRRYLRCDNFRERHKYGDAVEDDKTWTWNEKKLEEVRAQEEKRRNKRESCAEEIHVFEQRKVKCRRKEQDSSSSHLEGTQSEDLDKAEDFNRASCVLNNRPGAADEPKRQQVGQVDGCAYFADESTKNGRGPSLEKADAEIGDKYLNYISKQRPSPQFHTKRGNDTEENRACIAPRPEIELPSTPPIACSFISFKAGVTCAGNRKCPLPVNTSLRTRPHSDVESRATAICDNNEMQKQVSSNNRLFQEGTVHSDSIPHQQTERTVDLSLQRINEEAEGGDAQTNTGREGKPESLDDFKSLVRERERTIPSEILAARSWHSACHEVPFDQKPVGSPQEFPCSWSHRVTEGSGDRAADVVTGFASRGSQTSSRETSHSSVSKQKQAYVYELECGPHTINASHLHSQSITDAPHDRLSSKSLDSYGSYEAEDDLDITDVNGSARRSNEGDSDGELVSNRHEDGPSPLKGRVATRDDVSERCLDEVISLQVPEVKISELSDSLNIYVDDGNANTEDKLPSEIARDNSRTPRTHELEEQSFRSTETEIPHGKQSIGSHDASMSEKITAETVDLDPLPQKSMPLRRQAWVKGLKRKTGEKVGYFESWLGRGKKEISSRKPNRSSPGRKCGAKGVGELSHTNHSVESKLDNNHDKSRPFGHSLDQHLISQAWSKKESQAYVTKEFEILEAVLQSEVAMDDQKSKAVDYSPHTGQSGPVVDTVDIKKGRWQEPGITAGQSNSLGPDSGNAKTNATNLDAQDNPIHVRYSAGQDSPFECAEHTQGGSFQQLYLDDMSRACRASAKQNSFGGQELSDAGFPNNSASPTNERRQTVEEREGPLALSNRKSSPDDLNAISDRHSRKPQDEKKYRVTLERDARTSFERSTDVGMCAKSQDPPTCTRDAQVVGRAEQCGLLFENRRRNQEKKLTEEHDNVEEDIKPVRLAVLSDSRYISPHKVLGTIDVAAGERNMGDKFGSLAAEISGHISGTRIEIQSSPFNVTFEFGDSSKTMDSLVQVERLAYNPVNRASSAFSPQVPSSVQERSVSDIFEHAKQVKTSFTQVRQSPSESKCSQAIESEGKGVCIDENIFRPVAFGDSLIESDTAVDVEGEERNSANSISETEIDKFPSCIQVPMEKQIFEAESIKESLVNRRHKMPIIVRVRNRLANGWLLQHSLWKKVAKQKMKIGESEVLPTKGIIQKEIQADPSRLLSGQDSTRNSFTGKLEYRSENTINTKPTSKHETEQTATIGPQVSILDEHYITCTASENKKCHHGSFGDLDTHKCHSGIYEIKNKPTVALEIDEDKQSEFSKNHSTAGNDGEVQKDHMKNDDCSDQASSVVTFAEWQSRAAGFGKSISREKVGANLVANINDRQREVTGVERCEFNDVGELLSVVCLGNSVKEATVSGTLSEFDGAQEAPMTLGQRKADRESGRFRQLSAVDNCEEVRPPVCLGQREKISVDCQKPSDCGADEHILNTDSQSTKCSYCQTEPLVEAELLEKNETYTPMDSPANTSLENCCPSVGGESEVSQECESLQKYFSMTDQNEDLHTCSSASLDHACEGSPHIPETSHIAVHTGDLIDEQPLVDGQSDNMYFTPQVKDIHDYLSVETIVNDSAQLTSFQSQPCPERTAVEQDLKCLPKLAQPFGQAKVFSSFCPPLQATNASGKELIWGDELDKEREMKDLRRSTSKMRGILEDPLGDLKHWELVEMLKMPNNQQLLPKLKGFSSAGKQEYVDRTGKETNASESASQKDFGGALSTLYWKDVATHQHSNDLSTEEQVFLERFSATSREFKASTVRPNAHGDGGFGSLGQSCLPSSPGRGAQMRLLSAPPRLNCGKTESLSVGGSAECASLPSDVQLINSLHPCVCKRSSRALSEGGRPGSSQESKHEGHNAFESRLLSDYAPCFYCLPPSSSINRSPDISERQFMKGPSCTDCRNKYEEGETWAALADGEHGWKSSASQECFPSAQCQSLLLNSRLSSCRSQTSQSSMQCRCEPCNLTCRYSPPVLLSCHHPPCMANVQHHSPCHFAGLSHLVPVPFSESGMLQNTSAPHVDGLNVQYPKKDTLPTYSPMQGMQPSGTRTSKTCCRGDSKQPLLPHERHQFVDKNTGSQNCHMKGTERDKELVWLSEEEMTLIQKLRALSEKAAAVCRRDAAACIQRNWRQYLEKKKMENFKSENGQQAAALNLLTEHPMWPDHLRYWKLCQAAISLQTRGCSPKDLRHVNLVRRWYNTIENAATIIQRAWRSVLRNRKEKVLTGRGWPKDLKKFYDIIKVRLVTRGRQTPSFEFFAKSVKRIKAATEGARVRRRLKSHRLQTIIMEIKEIRMLLYELSQEEKGNSIPFLFPQLCTQLRQKISQLHAALNGKQMEPRFLLRRCPTTPLMIQPSRSTSPKPVYLEPHKALGQALSKWSLGPIGARKLYSPPLSNPASAVLDSRIACSDSLAVQLAAPKQQKFIQTKSFVPLIQGSKGNAIQLRNSSPGLSDSADPPDNVKLLQLYFLAQRSPTRCLGGDSTPTDFSSSHCANVKKGVMEIQDSSHKKSDFQSLSCKQPSPKSKDPEYSVDRSFDEQPLPVPQRRKIPEMSLEEMAVGGSDVTMYLTEYAQSAASTDKPKRPFLKRKSIAMPSQKLDWSKVKPMVSSRLEPELKNKRSLCKGPAKEPATTNSKQKKANYSKVKSRLFSYEENVSPSNSRDGTCLRSHTMEKSEAGYPPMLRSSTRESSIQGSDNGRYSQVLANRQRSASPDLMQLRSSMAEADRRRSPILDTQSAATYNSHFDSARYLHKLGNSEQASKGALIGSRQHRTQRSIRLRILPGSKESPVGDLFVQEEMQEMWENQSLSADGKGKKQQSHSHRYANYEEQDGKNSSHEDETSRPDFAEDDRKVTDSSSIKVHPLAHKNFRFLIKISQHPTPHVSDNMKSLRPCD